MILQRHAEATSNFSHRSEFRWSALLPVVLLVFLAAASHAEPPEEAPRTIALHPADGLELTLRPPSPDETVARLNSPSARCSEVTHRTADVTLSWTPVASAEPGVQRLEVTKFRDGFSALRAERSDELAANIDHVVLKAPEPGILYRWRVLTRAADNAWLASTEGRFEVPICPWDGE